MRKMPENVRTKEGISRPSIWFFRVGVIAFDIENVISTLLNSSIFNQYLPANSCSLFYRK